jgi:N-methylhydantoinase A
VTVPVEDGEAEGPFHELHEQLYTYRLGSPVEFVNFRLTGFGAVRKPELAPLGTGGAAEQARKGARDVDFDELGRHEARIYERDLLGAGAELDGPAVIEEPAASTVVFPRQRVRVDTYGNLVVDTGAA